MGMQLLLQKASAKWIAQVIEKKQEDFSITVFRKRPVLWLGEGTVDEKNVKDKNIWHWIICLDYKNNKTRLFSYFRIKLLD